MLLLAQAGVPLTTGFIAKFGVIQAAVEEHSYAIAIIAMLAAVIAAFLYLRIMVSMWIADPEPADAELRAGARAVDHGDGDRHRRRPSRSPSASSPAGSSTPPAPSSPPRPSSP